MFLKRKLNICEVFIKSFVFSKSQWRHRQEVSVSRGRSTRYGSDSELQFQAGFHSLLYSIKQNGQQTHMMLS